MISWLSLSTRTFTSAVKLRDEKRHGHLRLWQTEHNWKFHVQRVVVVSGVCTAKSCQNGLPRDGKQYKTKHLLVYNLFLSQFFSSHITVFSVINDHSRIRECSNIQRDRIGLQEILQRTVM